MTTPILVADSLTLGYHGTPAVHDLNLHVAPGSVVAVLGANGAGKTTSLLGLAGALPAMNGNVHIDGVSQNRGLASSVRRGMALVTDDRAIFRDLSVDDNLRLGRGSKAEAYDMFPQLRPLRKRRAGLLSGGEQQMLGLARVLAARPRLLLVDELSLGLAPVVVKPLFAALRHLADETGAAVVLVEQHVHAVLEIADAVMVLDRGRQVFQGPASDLQENYDIVTRAYLSH